MDTKQKSSPLLRRKLRRRADAVRRANEELAAEMKLAAREGWSLRQIAAEVDVSHVTVKRIVES